MPDVTQKLLTQQLQGFEAADLIDREVLVQIPSKVGRSISDLGFRTYTRAHDGLHHWLGHL